jgi:molybdate transport repressor ModE-like protein
MDMKHIRYFLEVARRGSINKAARSIGIAQPALTRYLHALEAEVGTQLMIRSQQGIRLTHTGEILLQHGRLLPRAAVPGSRKTAARVHG